VRKLAILAFLVSIPALADAGEPSRGYYRFPAIHGETIVFAAEGDLWTVGLAGGEARRLTTHPAEERDPAISPDGTLLAFTGAYEGTPEIYVMPLAGGVPRRLTYEGGTGGRRQPRVAGWTPGGKALAATAAYSTLPDVRLLALDPATGDGEAVPLAQASEGVYEPSGRTLFFTRQAFQGSHAKRYRGGTVQSLWRFTAGDSEGVQVEAVPLTADYPGTSRAPMWWDGRVWFASDRDGTVNLWSMDEAGGGLRQHTFHDGWDVQEAALEGGRVVYRLGADLRFYEVAADVDRALAVTLASDFDQLREQWIDEPLDYLTAAHLSPDGGRVALTARGEVFVAPVGDGRFVHVTRRPGVRYRQARFFPNGTALLALSDESGEVEWWRLPADGVGAAEQLTADGKVLRYDGMPSPDGRWIAHHDHDQDLWLYDVESRGSWKIASSRSFGFVGLPSWSPDSRWFAFSVYESNQLARIYLCRVDERAPLALTSERYHSYSPVWSPDGRWVWFLSDRHFESLVGAPWGERQPDPFFDRQTKVYAVALRPGLRFPFQPSDELRPREEKKEKGDEDDGDDAAVPAVEVVREGLAGRLHEAPAPPGNYLDLAIAGERLFWLREATTVERERDLMTLGLEPDAEPRVLVAKVAGYEPSLDGKKLLVLKGEAGRPRALYVVDASAPVPLELADEDRVDLAGWSFPHDPREEWRQMFVDAWRLHRDYFYDRGMHGVDWRATLGKYRPLADRVTSRGELGDLLGQMISELSALHARVRGGDHRPAPDEVAAAFLGAELARDEAAGGYRVARVYRADPDLPGELAPLARPGAEVAEGEVIVAVNGVPTLDKPPGASLRNQAGRQVRLTVRADGGGDRDVIAAPIDARRAWDLRYDAWEYGRRRRVEELGEGKVGYVHLRAMGPGDVGDWQRDFYPVFDRQGLIVDVRHNEGGNVDSWILGKLLRRAWMYWQGRSGEPYWNMQQAFRGHLVVLVDEWTGSDGEAFAEGFRRLGLGPVIGTRTWGGEIWLTSSNVLVDRGVATAAEFGVYGPEGEWLIEGHGVDPDVVVDNLPHATFNGEDAQLRAAIDYLLAKIREDPRPVPPAPAYPDKSRS